VAASGGVVLGKNGTAERHRRVERGEEVAADGLAPDSLGLSFAADAGGNERKVRGNATFEEARGLVAIVDVVGIGKELPSENMTMRPGSRTGRTPQSSPLATLKTVALAANASAMERITTKEKPGARSSVRMV